VSAIPDVEEIDEASEIPMSMLDEILECLGVGEEGFEEDPGEAVLEVDKSGLNDMGKCSLGCIECDLS
jgi:hypothetical protein